MSLAIVIMAAESGTHLKSKRPKVLHACGGKSLLEHVIAAAVAVARPEDVLVVVGEGAEKVEAAVAQAGVRFVEQPGTGHALQCAAKAVSEYADILVLRGDAPLIRAETMHRLLNLHRQEKAAMTILTAVTADPRGCGRVVREGNGADVAAIVEPRARIPGQETSGEIDSGINAFRVAPLIEHLNQLQGGVAHEEIVTTNIAGIMRGAGERVVALEAEDTNEVLGVYTIAELVAVDALLRRRTVQALMAQGVTIFMPETSVIDVGVEIGPDTIIEPHVQLLGATRIGSDCRIRSWTVIENSILGDGVLIRQSCVIAESKIHSEAKIGPFSHLRPGSDIGPEAHIGSFVETKKATLGRGAKANHLSYLGDTEIGSGANIGAGVITCNYDGVNKHVTRIGEEAFVGSDSTLVAPVTVGDRAYIGAGSCITRDVPADSLAIGRSRQVIKEGWAAARRAQRNG